MKGRIMSNKHASRLLLAAAVAVTTIAGATASTAASAASAPAALYTTPLIGSVSSSSNWTGYIATGKSSEESFYLISAYFSVPSLNCSATPDGYASQWVGMDGVGYGLSASSTVEADGITGQCIDGTPSYQAWWETYPQPQTVAFTVNAGDAITASVTAPSSVFPGKYVFSLGDVTTGQYIDLEEPCGAAQCLDSSAEAISSAPSDSATLQASSVLPIADYAAENFGAINIRDTADENGGFTSSAWTYNLADQVNPSTGELLGAAADLSGGQAFTNLWEPPTLAPSAKRLSQGPLIERS
jgi:hypothetical protein